MVVLIVGVSLCGGLLWMPSGWVVPFARVPLWAGLFAKVVFLEIFGQETQGSRADLRKGKKSPKTTFEILERTYESFKT